MSVVDDSHVNADVASGGIRVGAHLVGLVSELLSLIVRQSRDNDLQHLSLIHISEPTRREWLSRMPSSA